MKIVLLTPPYEAEREVAKYRNLTVECFKKMSGLYWSRFSKGVW